MIKFKQRGEAATPTSELLPPGDFRGDPVDPDRDNQDEGATSRPSDSQSATPRQDYLPPRDEYLPPKESKLVQLHLLKLLIRC